MNEFYYCFFFVEECWWVENIEFFDEFEEWYLKCVYYFILVVFRGDIFFYILVFLFLEVFFCVNFVLFLGVFFVSVVSSEG